jgi:predicted ATP-grasp superfamily ATP-dependent carboligase/GNAT superfamily N-acetyltransferase
MPPSHRSIWQRWQDSVRELGLVGALKKGLDWALRSLSGGSARFITYALMAQPIGAGAFAAVRSDAATVTEELKPGQALAEALPRPAAINLARWATGAQCLAATVKGAFAGTVWIAREHHEEDEVRCQYLLDDATQSVWDYDVYVEPRYRGSRVLARLWQAVDARLAAEGVRWSFSRISLLNPGSLAAHERMGARRIGLAAFLVLGSLQLSLFSVAPFIHLGLTRHSRPRVRMKLPSGSNLAATASAPRSGRSPASLVLGLDSHGLTVARAMADAGVPVYALNVDHGLPGAASNRVRRVFALPSFSDEHLLQALRSAAEELRGHTSVALIAINDRQVAAIGRLLKDLPPLYRVSWASQAERLLALAQKDRLEAVSVKQGLAYPKSALFTHATLPLPAHGLGFPIILKPVQPLSSFKTLLAGDASELHRHLSTHQDALPILAQEYVPGGDECLYFGALMLDRGRVLHGMAGRKVASHPPARGQTTIAQAVDAPEVLARTEQFFAGMELSGPVSLELKRDALGRHWVIEPTVGRTDFWVGLCIGAGFNQPLMHWQLACGLPVTSAGPMRHCMWYDTERDPMAWLRLCWQERTLRPRGGRQVFPYLSLGDPKPALRALRLLLRRKLWRRLWPKLGPKLG